MAERILLWMADELRKKASGPPGDNDGDPQIQIDLANHLTRVDIQIHGITFVCERNYEIRKPTVKEDLPDPFP